MEELNFLEQALNKGNGALTVKESRMVANCLDALAGYYSDGIFWRYWNGTEFITSGGC